MTPTTTAPRRAKASTFTATTEPPAPVSLLTWQNVDVPTLQQYAPPQSLPVPQYAVQCVMAWAQAQGFAGAIPTWETATNPSGWGVIAFNKYAGLSQITIPISAMESFETSDTAGWSQAVMRWATANGYQVAIPTFQSDGVNVTALAFDSTYPTITFYDSPNAELVESLAQPRLLVNLQDPAVWANAVMRVALAKGYGAGWPTWEWTTNRGIMGLPAYDYGALPDATDDNADRIIAVLDKTITAFENGTNEALAEFSGIYQTFNEAPVSDPGLQILVTCLYGAVQAGLNMIPVVGGAISSLVSTAVTVAQQAAATALGGSGPTTLETYQKALAAASSATQQYVAQIHDDVVAAKKAGTLSQIWPTTYQNPLSGLTIQLGMLALSPDSIVSGDEFWVQFQEQLATEYDLNLEMAIMNQLYMVERRTYNNAPPEKQWWYGTIATVTAPGGPLSQYVVDEPDDWSVWFSDFVAEPGHARGPYVTATEFWLQSPESTGLPTYAPQQLCKALFSDDGFGVTTGWTGAFTKSNVYLGWLMTIVDVGLDGGFAQTWTYGTNGNIVTATVSSSTDSEYPSGVAGYTDAYGNLFQNPNLPLLVAANQSGCGFTQGVLVNYVGYLS